MLTFSAQTACLDQVRAWLSVGNTRLRQKSLRIKRHRILNLKIEACTENRRLSFLSTGSDSPVKMGMVDFEAEVYKLCSNTFAGFSMPSSSLSESEKSRDRRVTAMLKPQEADAFITLCEVNGVSMSTGIRMLVLDALRRNVLNNPLTKVDASAAAFLQKGVFNAAAH